MMAPSLRLQIAGALLLACAGCEKPSVCGPYATMNLPGVTQVDRCDADPSSDYGISGETTADGSALVKAIAQSGFELGRDGKTPFEHAAKRQHMRKDGTTYAMFTDLGKRPSGANYFSIQQDKVRSWVPEESWQKVQTSDAARQTLIDKLRGTSALLDATPSAPEKCAGSLDALDPTLASEPRKLLVNLDARDFREAGAHGPSIFLARVEKERRSYEQLDQLVAEREEIDRLAARRVVAIVKATEYQPVKDSSKSTLPSSRDQVRFVTGGDAKFVVAVVDLKENRILCRSKGEASVVDRSKTAKNAPVITQPDGKQVAFNVQDVTNVNLDTKIAEAARAELARMSPAFAR
ncbi:hypothetical protein [Chondromyces crocatus]|uniref:Lipoprotein n=1 Tax=Chondromyces crocatus TaxID=52 RepID=A0A0K1ESF0_CHOCO|nr:hypothetical protein [Chondromyces crocatus]AKT43557.1 uncharacterized protein CMC5_077890 [Chondromyces crocatus]